MTFPVNYDPNAELLKIRCSHFCVSEIGMVGYYRDTVDCGYGCKIVQCDLCKGVFETHNATYGCKKNVGGMLRLH